jgi:hypothetical protein
MNCCTQAKFDCAQGRLCPLREAHKRGFVAPRPPQPEESSEPDHWSKPALWILGAAALACLAAALCGIALTIPFN